MSSLVATGTFTIIDVNDGMRTASLTMYQWSLNAPTTFPSGSSTYTWASQAFTAPATLNGWSITPPASAAAGQSLWVCFADYTDNLSTATSTITWSTALAYPIGAAGAQGPSVVVNANLPEVFTATDGTLDSGQANIVFTTLVSGVTTPTYVWTFSGFQTAPTNSGTSTQTITAAQFGTSKSATVTCTVNGVYLDTITVVRLEKTTAAAGATVGATFGTNISGQITPSNASTYISNLAVDTLQIAGNAVTVPVGASTSVEVIIGTTLTNAIQATIALSIACPIIVTVHYRVASQLYNTGSGALFAAAFHYFTIYRDTTEIFNSYHGSYNSWSINEGMSVVDSPGIGTFTYYLKIACLTAGSVTTIRLLDAGITLLGGKR